MAFLRNFLMNLPEVKAPVQRVGFKEKLKWTGIILVSFFVLSAIPLFGLGQNALQQFESLAIILASSFGSVLSLGIGPIVTASIVLQLLTGSGILKIDMTPHEGRKTFQGLQKVLAILFILFESLVFVLMGGLAPAADLAAGVYKTTQFLLIFQLFLGGLMVLYMDEVVSKWGFGSGVSLFIAAGVAQQIFIRAFSPLTTTGAWAFGSGQPPVGSVLVLVTSLIRADPRGASLALAAILATVLVLLLSIYAQSMKAEIPLSFGKIRGHGMRWPLRFLYTSNIPVILIAALMANIQLWAGLLERSGRPILGTFSNGIPTSGLVTWFYPPDIVRNLLTGAFTRLDLYHALGYTLIMVIGSVIFAIFWVQTAGMDAKSKAKEIMAIGLQIPGFRRDERVLENRLSRYIFPLTVMGAIAVGLLASIADLAGALSRGTGILLAVMIIYNLYESIAQQHMMDMYPALRKVMEK